MSRVKLSEYGAKLLLIDQYKGFGLQLESLDTDIKKIEHIVPYVVKVDQGIKKRGKKGLIRLDVHEHTVLGAVHELEQKGFNRFIAEPMFRHDDVEEQYISFERVREGIRILHSTKGGIDIEESPDSIQHYLYTSSEPAVDMPAGVPKPFIEKIVSIMNEEHMSFIEMNPIVVRGQDVHILDAAVLVDSSAAYISSWTSDNIVEASQQYDSEDQIALLNNGSPAAFSFKILNENGPLWLLLSGGGASIAIADEAANQGKGDYISNYGEYSGGPTTEETYIYTKVLLTQLLQSNSEKIALVIAGGVANFTDVKKTFAGVIHALSEYTEQLQAKQTKVFVRRGGPNETEGLRMIETFLKQNNLYGSVHGSDKTLTIVVDEALEYIDA